MNTLTKAVLVKKLISELGFSDKEAKNGMVQIPPVLVNRRRAKTPHYMLIYGRNIAL